MEEKKCKNESRTKENRCAARLYTKSLVHEDANRGNVFAKGKGFPYTVSMKKSFEHAADEIIRAGNRLDRLGLAPATSGNYSMRLDDGTLALTVSGAHKGELERKDIMRVSADGTPKEDKKPSAETRLHTVIYDLFPHANAILHSHSIPLVVLTRHYPQEKFYNLEGYELLKVFPGIGTHDVRISVPVFDNTQDMEDLGRQVRAVLSEKKSIPAFMIRSHGLYGWGGTMKEAAQVVEGLEVLLSCELETLKLKKV